MDKVINFRNKSHEWNWNWLLRSELSHSSFIMPAKNWPKLRRRQHPFHKTINSLSPSHDISHQPNTQKEKITSLSANISCELRVNSTNDIMALAESLHIPRFHFQAWGCSSPLFQKTISLTSSQLLSFWPFFHIPIYIYFYVYFVFGPTKPKGSSLIEQPNSYFVYSSGRFLGMTIAKIQGS